jgi:plastocyanin
VIAPLASSVNAFHILGGVLALWAVLVAGMGIARPRFPFSDRGARMVGGITAVLVVAAISSAVLTAENGSTAHGTAAHEADAGEPSHGGEESPAAGGEQAPAAGGEESPAAGGEKLELSADPSGQLKFDKTELEAKAGAVELVMTNPSPVPHDIAIEGPGVDEKGEVVEKDGQSHAAADVKPGEYTFYCSVPGHRQGGMEGKLVVR